MLRELAAAQPENVENYLRIGAMEAGLMRFEAALRSQSRASVAAMTAVKDAPPSMTPVR